MKVKLSKVDLNNYSTFLGFMIGALAILISYGWLEPKTGGTIYAILKLAEGYLINKPASRHPTTEDLEQRKS